MKSKFVSAVIIGMVILTIGCKKTDSATLPSLTTQTISNVSVTSASGGGSITSDGNASITGRGVCWSTTSNPSISDSRTSDGVGTGQFVSNLTGLAPSTVYYVRAYATNSVGTAYGNEVSFTTAPVRLAELTTTQVTLITDATAVSGGNITDDGSSDITARGVCWSTSHGPTISGSHTSDGAGKGGFVSNLTGLTSGTLYYVRAYATNSNATYYGNEVSFTTTGQSAGTGSVNIQSMAFTPQSLTVSVNTTVTWTNNDGMTHTVTSDTPLFDSGNMSGSAGTFSYKFTAVGTFSYHCTLHPGMTGSVIVQ